MIKQKFKDITIKNISDHIVVQTIATPKKFISYIYFIIFVLSLYFDYLYYMCALF